MLRSTSRIGAQQPTNPTQDEFDDDFEGFNSDLQDKSETEIELEKLVFGDEKGFRDSLKIHRKHGSAQCSSVAEGNQAEGPEGLEDGEIEGLDDADVRTVDLSLRASFR